MPGRLPPLATWQLPGPRCQYAAIRRRARFCHKRERHDAYAFAVTGQLAALARKNVRAKTSVLQEALTGHFTDHHAFMLGMMLARIDALTT